MLLLLLAVGLMGRGQVLGGSSTFGSNTSLGIYLGTQHMFGRTFSKMNMTTSTHTAIEPTTYRQRLFDPAFGIEWSSETPDDQYFFGYHIVCNVGMEKYQVGFDEIQLTTLQRWLEIGFGGCVGFHFTHEWSGSVGVLATELYSISGKKGINIFSSLGSLCLTAMARYDLNDDFFVSLRATYGVLPILRGTGWTDGFNRPLDMQDDDSLPQAQYYSNDIWLKSHSVMVGIGHYFN